jgi:hypothetical protein
MLFSVAALAPMTEPAAALSEAVARKCHQLALKTYPRPRTYAAYKGGDPAAARMRQAFYKDCVSRGDGPEK